MSLCPGLSVQGKCTFSLLFIRMLDSEINRQKTKDITNSVIIEVCDLEKYSFQ